MKNYSFILIIWSTCTTSMAQGFGLSETGRELGRPLYLISRERKEQVNLAETMMTNGNFEFTGKVPEPTIAYIVTDKQQPIATLMLENREFTLTAGTDLYCRGRWRGAKILNEFEALNKRLSGKFHGARSQGCLRPAKPDEITKLKPAIRKTVRDIQTQQRNYYESTENRPWLLRDGICHGQMNFEQLTEIIIYWAKKPKHRFSGKISVQLAFTSNCAL